MKEYEGGGAAVGKRMGCSSSRSLKRERESSMESTGFCSFICK